MTEGETTFPEGILVKEDTMLETTKGQGYVPEGCYLSGMLVWGLVNEGKDPCDGCRAERIICKGRVIIESESVWKQ